MLSIIIATLDSERDLVRTLAALVPGATAGLVSEVLVADGGSRDETTAVADIAGCNLLTVEGPQGRRLRAAAAAARASWLMFLQPGAIPHASWVDDVARYMEQHPLNDGAAVFRRAGPPRPALREALALLTAAFGARQRPEQGLLLSRRFYEALGGHSERTDDPETDLLRRIGRRRILTLSTGIGAVR